MVLGLMITLMVSALNISNESINQLTGEDRKAVLAVTMDDSNINLQLLGEEYQLSEPAEKSLQLFDCCCKSIRNYLLSICNIFDAVVWQR